MRQLSFLSLGLILFISLFTLAPNASFGYGGGETIIPIPKVNKEFLVVVHIIMDKDSVPGVTESEINLQMAATNSYFAPIGAKFTICEFKYIYNFNYNDLNPGKEADLWRQYRVKNRINMFFANSMDIPDFPGVCGNATLGGINRANDGGVLILKGNCNNDHTIAHELGHYFNLSHTFEDVNGLELADGSNCDTAGDGICDTPADPFDVKIGLSTYINSSCTFIFTGKDGNNQFYNPDVSNIMSYYPPDCGCPKFTHDQYVKMANYYLSNPISW